MKNLISIFFLIIFLSCNGKKEKIYDSKIVISDSIALPLNDSNYFSWNTQVLTNKNSTMLYRENYMFKEIKIYNLNKKTEELEIELKTDGPNSIQNIVAFGFIPHKEDSIELVNTLGYYFNISKDSVFNRIDMFEKESDNSGVYFKNDNHLLRLNDSLLGFGQYKQLNIKSDAFLKSSVFALWDKKNRRFSNSQISFPLSYLDKCWAAEMLDFNYTLNEKTNEIIFSFPASHNLYAYNYETHSTTEIKFKRNSYFDEIESFTKCSNEEVQEAYYFLTTPSYLNIVYDCYKDIYYRFFLMPAENINKFSDVSYIHKQLGVIIYNNSFEIISETLFERFRFMPRDYFITEKGLWLSNNNPENPNFEEDKLKFSLLTLQPNEK